MRNRKTATDWHWEKRALELKDDARVNIGDTVQRELESAFVFEHLPANGRVLEVGCGNGFLTAQLREKVNFVDAFDFSSAMVARARDRYGEKNNRFFQDNVLDAKGVRPPYDAVVCIRVLINLADLQEQRAAVANMARWLRPSGKLILVEGYADGFERLNELRQRAGIEPMRPAAINYYSYIDELMPEVTRYFDVTARFHTGMYDFLTRVVYPALVGVDAASGPGEFHARIGPVAAAYNPDILRELARVHGMVLTRRDGR